MRVILQHCYRLYPEQIFMRSGAFSNVYKAVDARTGQKVAGKYSPLYVIEINAQRYLRCSQSRPQVRAKRNPG